MYDIPSLWKITSCLARIFLLMNRFHHKHLLHGHILAEHKAKPRIPYDYYLLPVGHSILMTLQGFKERRLQEIVS